MCSVQWEDVVGHRRLVATVDLSRSPGGQHCTGPSRLICVQASGIAPRKYDGHQTMTIANLLTITPPPISALPCSCLVGRGGRLLGQQPELFGGAGSPCVHPRPAPAPGGGAQR